MKRHETDFVSLVFGLFFLAIAGWWAVAYYVRLNVDVPNFGWFAAGALIVLGLIGVGASLRGSREPAEIGSAEIGGPAEARVSAEAAGGPAEARVPAEDAGGRLDDTGSDEPTLQ